MKKYNSFSAGSDLLLAAILLPAAILLLAAIVARFSGTWCDITVLVLFVAEYIVSRCVFDEEAWIQKSWLERDGVYQENSRSMIVR